MKRTNKAQKIVKMAIAAALVVTLGTYVTETREIEEGQKKYDELTQVSNDFMQVNDILLEEAEVQEPDYDITAMKETYPDIVGYLEGSALPCPYPVMKESIFGKPYYSNHLPNGEENSIGSVCFNEENSFDLTDDFSVIYAHNIEGAMFGDLSNYSNSDYMNNEENYFIYHSEYGKYKLEPFAYYISENVVYGEKDDSQKQLIIDELKNSEIINQNIEVGIEDNIVTLFTCLDMTDPNYYIHPELRVMIACKVTPLVLYNNINYSKVG